MLEAQEKFLWQRYLPNQNELVYARQNTGRFAIKDPWTSNQ